MEYLKPSGKLEISLILILVLTGLFVVSAGTVEELKTLASGANVYSNDLVIEAGERKVIEGKEVKLKGDLILEPNSKFILRNSTLFVLQEYKSQYSIEVGRGALFKAVGSTIETYKESTRQYETDLFRTDLNLSSFAKDSNIVIKDSNISARLHPHQPSKCVIEDSKVAYLYWVPRSDARVSNSTLGSFVFGFKSYTKPEKLTFKGFYPNEGVNYQTTTADGGSLSLENTLVKRGWNFNMEFTPKEITIKDSHLQLIWIKFPPTEKEIEIRLERGKIDRFSLQKHVKGLDLPYNVTLINTEIESFKPEMFGTKAVFEDVYAMIHSYEGSTLCIRDSTVHTPFIYGAKEIKFINTTLEHNLRFIYKPEFSGPGGYSLPGWEEIVGAGGMGKVVFHNSKIDVEEISVACVWYTIEGEVRITSPTSIDKVFWTRGTIRRTYLVEVRGQNGEPCAGVPVVLSDGKGNKISKKRTNNEGNVAFNINFHKQNYERNWKLEISTQDSGESKSVGFLTSTPILFRTSQSCG